MSLRPLLPALPSLPAEPAGPSMWDSIQALGRGAERKMARERKHGTAACTPQFQISLPIIGSIPLSSECDLDLGDGKDYHGTAPNCDPLHSCGLRATTPTWAGAKSGRGPNELEPRSDKTASPTP